MNVHLKAALFLVAAIGVAASGAWAANLWSSERKEAALVDRQREACFAALHRQQTDPKFKGVTFTFQQQCRRFGV